MRVATERNHPLPIDEIQHGGTALVVVQPCGGCGQLAILLAMSSTADQLPLAEVKNRLSEVVDRVEREHERVVITKHGRPAAVVLSIEDLESLEESLEILSDPTLLAEIRVGERERSSGATTKLSKSEALARVRQG